MRTLTVSGLVEIGTGVVLVLAPQALARLLFAADLAGAGLPVARIAGAALVSLGLICWLVRADPAPRAPLAGMLT